MSSDDMMPWPSGGSSMPWQGWQDDDIPWNKDDNWNKMPWNWNSGNAPWNNWSGDGRGQWDKYNYKRKSRVTVD